MQAREKRNNQSNNVGNEGRVEQGPPHVPTPEGPGRRSRWYYPACAVGESGRGEVGEESIANGPEEECPPDNVEEDERGRALEAPGLPAELRLKA